MTSLMKNLRVESENKLSSFAFNKVELWTSKEHADYTIVVKNLRFTYCHTKSGVHRSFQNEMKKKQSAPTPLSECCSSSAVENLGTIYEVAVMNYVSYLIDLQH